MLAKKIGLCLVGALWITNLCADNIDGIVAVVENMPLTKSSLDTQMQHLSQEYERRGQMQPDEKTLRHIALNRYIDVTLQLLKAAEYGIHISKGDVDAAIENLAAQQQLTPEELFEKVEQSGQNIENYRQMIARELKIAQVQKRLLPPIAVSDEEVKNYIQHHPQQHQLLMEYHLLDIKIPLPDEPTANDLQSAEKITNEIRAQYKKQSDLYQIVGQIKDSVVPSITDLDWRSLQDLPDEFASQMSLMQQNDLSVNIQTENGIHILQLLGTRTPTDIAETTQVHIAQILIKPDPWTLTPEDALKTIESIQAQIKRGDSSFATIAKEFSQDPRSAPEGGDLGWIYDYDLPPQMIEALTGLEPGEVSDPIQTYEGWMILKLIDHRKVDAAHDLLARSVKNKLYQEKRERQLFRWLSELRESAYINIIDD